MAGIIEGRAITRLNHSKQIKLVKNFCKYVDKQISDIRRQ